VTLNDVLAHFNMKPSELAEKLGVTAGAISQWKSGIPAGRQFQIEIMTNGRLKAGPTKSEGAKAA